MGEVLTAKDMCVLLSIICVLIVIMSVYVVECVHPDNSILGNVEVTPELIVPEYYFLGYYGLIKAIPSKLSGMGVIMSILVRYISSVSTSIGMVSGLSLIVSSSIILISIVVSYGSVAVRDLSCMGT